MCGYCGCQELTAIEDLTAEHDAIVTLSGTARRALAAGELDTAADAARVIATILGPHSVVEEEGLFPAMVRDFGEHVQALVAEHRTIEAVLAQSVEGTPIDPTWPQALEDTLDALREHIIKEEDGVFPAALTVLEPAQWEQIAAVRERVGSHTVAATAATP
jgi:hypothetical protein